MNSSGVCSSHRREHGGLIDRDRPLSFSFDGRRYAGYAGDTLASALLAHGVKLVGRSFKYHRPRGILTSGSDEPNALVELRTGARREPNTRATVAELFDGLDARSQNRWPSLAWDAGSINSLFSPIMVAGFYYKTFMWPAAFWEKVYEPLIRRAAGLGRASDESDPDTYEKAYAFCDVLIVGGGAAGLAAALVAGRSGARVILCDEDFVLGGRLNGDRRVFDDMSGLDWVRQAAEELDSLPQVRVMRRTTVFGVYDGNTFGAVERVCDHLPVPPAHQPRQRLWRIVAKQVVLATGAIERPIVFGGNDRPGVMMASAARTYLNRYGVIVGHRPVLFTSCDEGWTTALDLVRAEVAVEAVVDTRPMISPSLSSAARKANLRVLLGSHVIGTGGACAVSRIKVRKHDGVVEDIRADALCVSGGWNPNIALSTHLGGRPHWSAASCVFLPSELRGAVAVGAARGSFSLAAALEEGAIAGAEAARTSGYPSSDAWSAPRVDDELTSVTACWYVAGSIGKAFVDFQNDVTHDDVVLAVREGFSSVEHVKRYTTLGMGTDQGRTSNINGLAILASATGHSIPDIGTTVFRPPYTPVPFGAFAGHHRGKSFRPTRLTSGHRWAVERGAQFVEAGNWLRAQWFAEPGEDHWLQTVVREVKAVRKSVGLCDVSTLGKIDIQGKDAATFLDRVYINLFSTLPVGKTRYGIMLREDGFVMDDGTTAHIAPGHYIMSTTTVNAAKVMQHLEYARQVIWPDLDVQIVSVTEQWSQYSIAGPNSRRLLERLLGKAIDVSNEAFPYLACAEFSWRGLSARLFRISFSGELAFELAVPSRYGDPVLRALMAAGQEFNIVPYGLEALGVMRVEKGHVAGNELNGMTTATDLGFGRMMSTKKDFIGKGLAGRPALVNEDRPSLVGVLPVDRNKRLYAGAHFLTKGASVALQNDQGYLTSVAFSPMLNHWIGLGLLARGRQRVGERVRAYDPLRSGETKVEVVSPIFFDPEGARLKV